MEIKTLNTERNGVLTVLYYANTYKFGYKKYKINPNSLELIECVKYGAVSRKCSQEFFNYFIERIGKFRDRPLRLSDITKWHDDFEAFFKKLCKRAGIAFYLREKYRSLSPQEKKQENKKARAYYKKNEAAIKERSKKYYAENKEKTKERQAEYREKHREKARAVNKKYYQNNKEKIDARHKIWYEQNREKRNAYAREYYQKKKLEVLNEKVA
jgi:hypothetical protein